ncbi:NAD(P)-dependent oxidoreductase [Anaerotignum lactatifermentans]|uniref:NAD(P)-dependent oxidoreductase n=1 Tax=Anaerotignum lactatifermentans TaxID=160404 RepID=A0ABS2GD65_9FIRM|nr:NAD(P)-dependent oxidoreductase [Anaerotignum lactatifermentans]MBM6828644.1 NAD(P)-dependent oxidoreductase [Anaerotignum lactatifermentans]MBM6878562.1 NAD(P)-dependent oxidoreductase [Anaerotignum lactatifermentans]MBM6950226.1 NAD(P)-dependent oxidoreductase [Anaerotignum lactatifermentans]
MKKAIVTGACGFVGRALTECLRQKGVEVLAVGRARQREQASFGEGVTFAAAEEMTEADWLRLGCGVEVFYHLAWSGSAGKGRGDLLLQAENLRQAALSLERAAALGCEKWIGAGSIAEGEAIKSQNPAPSEIYGWAKKAAWEMCRRHQGETEVLWGRITNAYGAGEDSSRLICRSLKEISRGRRLSFTDGTQLYDFLYITDAAEAFFLLGEKGKGGKAYTIGSGRARPLRQWLEILLSESGGQGDFGILTQQGSGLTAEELDSSQLRKDTGFLPQVDFREGIRRTMAWQKEAGLWDS